MKVLDAAFVKGFMQMAEDGWQKGWHERNGGNLSYRIRPEEIESVKEELNPGEWIAIGTEVPLLGGQYFLITGTGRYFQNVMRKPAESFGIIELDEKGENYRICWGLENGGRPTSEIPTHLMNHEVKFRVTNGAHRVIYHCHPVNTIALTFVLPLTDEVFTREIWEMITECPIVFPAGIGVVPWMVCGSSDIAYATGEKIKQFDAVIWSHHGIFCCGQDFDVAFGLMDTIEKSAEILIKVMSCGGKKQFITREQILALAEPYNVPIDPGMLD